MKSAWMLRPHPHGIDRMKEFEEKSIIAIGWPGIGDLSNRNVKEMKKRLSEPQFDLSNYPPYGSAFGIVDSFVNSMEPGDIVVVPDGDDVHFAEVISEYTYVKACDNAKDGYPHQRNVKWLACISRKNLPMELRSALKARQPVVNMQKHYPIIYSLAKGKPLTKAQKPAGIVGVEVAYPLRPDFKVQFYVPKDMTQAEAKRLADHIATLYFAE